MIPLLAVVLAVVLVGLMLLYDWRQRRREARRRAAAVFLEDAARWAQKGRRRRPKADPRIQRRRYGL